MRRLNAMTHEEVIEYNLRDGGTAVSIFADTQTDRISRVRTMVSDVLSFCPPHAVIWELGCSAGDIGGWFSRDHETHGVDVVPAAVRQCRLRYPRFEVVCQKVEDLEPQPCDLLVLCEFLEHVTDPVKLVQDWLPLARYAVIGHPLVGDGWDGEPGHVWAYKEEDFRAWFPLGGHTMQQITFFPMYDLRMVLGWGSHD